MFSSEKTLPTTDKRAMKKQALNFNEPGKDQGAIPKTGLSRTRSTDSQVEERESLSYSDTRNPKWTVYDSSQNLSAVLNDPRLAKRESDFFTKTWGEAFTDRAPIMPCPHLRPITKLDFHDYLKKTTKRIKQVKIGVQSSHAVEAEKKYAADEIPKIFSQQPFELENPEVFNSVLPWSQIMSPGAANTVGASKASVKLLQEKLTHYLDLVEVQIARQVSLKSHAFFQAMTSHDALMDQLTHNIKAVTHLRKQFKSIDNVLVKESLKVLNLKHSRHNYVELYKKLKLMSTVNQTIPTVQLLISTSEFAGALDLISTTKEIAEQELVGIHCFKHLGSQLAEIEGIINIKMKADFERHISLQLNRPLPVENSLIDEKDIPLLVDEEELVAIVFGMLRLNKLEFIDTFRDEARTAIERVVKQTEIEFVSNEDQPEMEKEKSSLNEQTQLLEFVTWLNLLKVVFHNLIQLLKRIQAVQMVMLEIVDKAAGTLFSSVDDLPVLERLDDSSDLASSESTSSSSSILSSSDHLRLNIFLKDTMASVCDQANKCCVKLLSSRSNKNGSNYLEKMRVSDFVCLARSIEQFTADVAVLCGKPSTPLRLALQSMATHFVLRFHEEKKFKLSQILDSEQWKQAEVPAEFQLLVDHSSKTGSLSVLNKDARDVSDLSMKQAENFLYFGNQKFAVVGTVLLLLTILVDYCDCASDVPIVSMDLARRLIDLLKFYNSRTCQLVLGAGALQLVGLKTITTKNLALASRSLQLIVLYIPLVKDHFERLLQLDKHQTTSKNFDQILKDYNHHVNEITNKFVGIIDNKIESLLSKWVVKAPVPSPAFRSMSKHLSKLHEAVVDLLPEDQLQDLFRRIHYSFKEKLKTHLVRLKVSSDGGPQHGLVTQEMTFYTENLRILNMFPDSNENVDDLWNCR